MKLIDDPGSKERRVEFAASLAKQASHLPVISEIRQGRVKIDLATATNHDVVRELPEAGQSGPVRGLGGQDDDGRNAMSKYRCVRINAP
jgi:hypothetical protein